MTNNKSTYYQNSAFILKVFKYISILLFVIFLISCVVIFRKDITIENIQLLAKFINFDGSSSNYTDEFTVTAGEDSDIIMLRDNLGIINHNNIGLYDLSGQKLFNYNFSYSTPSVDYDEHSIIVHDIDGNEMSIFNSFSKIKSFKYSGSVLSADVDGDYFAVITKDDAYYAILKVYKYDYQERDYIDIFTLKSSSSYLTSVGISGNGRYVIVSTADADEGKYNCYVNIYNTASNDITPLYSYCIGNELPFEVGFDSHSSSVYAITDSAVHFFDSKLNLTNTYKFNQSKVENYYESDDLLILTEKNNLSGNSVMLIGFSKQGENIFNINVGDEIYDVSIGKKKIFALGKYKVYEFSPDDDKVYSQTNEQALSSKYFSIVCDTDDNCYVVNDSYVTKIKF